MYTIDHCAGCGSTNVSKKTAYLSQFVSWRTTGNKPMINMPNLLVNCNDCGFSASRIRFTNEEEANLYKDYRGEKYNRMRLECEPKYETSSIFNTNYINDRLEFITEMIGRNIDSNKINSVLDYGGGAGELIPPAFTKAIKYVYDISGVEPLDGIKKLNPTTDKDPIDFIMCCQVLEHKSDMDELINILKSYMVTDSWIYIEVPAYKNPPPDDIIIGEHINFFNEQSLVAILDRHGIRAIDTTKNYTLGAMAVLGKFN